MIQRTALILILKSQTLNGWQAQCLNLGIESTRIIDNSGVFLSTQILQVCLSFLLYILRRCCPMQRGSCCDSCTHRFFRILVWNLFLRCWIQMSLELGLTSILNLQFMSFGTITDTLSTGISLCILSLLILLPFLILRIVSVKGSTLATPQYRRKYGAIYSHTARLKNYSKGIYYPLVLMHRYFFLLVIFSSNIYGLLQAILMCLSTLLLLMYLILFKPFNTSFDVIFTIINTSELFLVFGTCAIFCFLDHPSALQFRQQMGFVFMIFVFLLFFVNISAVVIYSFHTCFKRKHAKDSEDLIRSISNNLREKYKRRSTGSLFSPTSSPCNRHSFGTLVVHRFKESQNRNILTAIHEVNQEVNPTVDERIIEEPLSVESLFENSRFRH